MNSQIFKFDYNSLIPRGLRIKDYLKYFKGDLGERIRQECIETYGEEKLDIVLSESRRSLSILQYIVNACVYWETKTEEEKRFWEDVYYSIERHVTFEHHFVNAHLGTWDYVYECLLEYTSDQALDSAWVQAVAYDVGGRFSQDQFLKWYVDSGQYDSIPPTIDVSVRVQALEKGLDLRVYQHNNEFKVIYYIRQGKDKAESDAKFADVVFTKF